MDSQNVVEARRREQGEAGTSTFFFKPLRSVSESGQLEGLQVPCCPPTSSGGGDVEGLTTSYDGGDTEVPGHCRTLALCPDRDLLFVLAPDRTGLWIYRVNEVLEAYQTEGNSLDTAIASMKGHYV